MSIPLNGIFTNLLANYEHVYKGDFTSMWGFILVIGVVQAKFTALPFLQTSSFAHALGKAKYEVTYFFLFDEISSNFMEIISS